VQQAKENLEESAMEYGPHELVTIHSASKAVTVRQDKTLTVNLCNKPAVANDLHPQTLEVMINPNIMVAGEEVNIDPRLYKISDGRKDLNIAFGHNVLVLVPKVPNVPQKIQGLGAGGRNGP